MNKNQIKSQIEDGSLDWKTNSAKVAQFTPELIDPDKYNWEDESMAIAKYAPKYFDTDRYNWKKDGWYIAKHHPELFDPKKFNWEQDSSIIPQYCPNCFDPKLYNWKRGSLALIKYAPQFFDPNLFDWTSKINTDALKKYMPKEYEKYKGDKFNESAKFPSFNEWVNENYGTKTVNESQHFQVDEKSLCSEMCQEKLYEACEQMMKEMTQFYESEGEETLEEYVKSCESLIEKCMETLKTVHESLKEETE